jgi:hypothetical protein
MQKPAAGGVTTLSNGDKFFISDEGTVTTIKEGRYTEQGTWNFTGGTGKLRGIQGKGTFKGKAAAEGTTTVEVKGDYQLPAS